MTSFPWPVIVEISECWTSTIPTNFCEDILLTESVIQHLYQALCVLDCRSLSIAPEKSPARPVHQNPYFVHRHKKPEGVYCCIIEATVMRLDWSIFPGPFPQSFDLSITTKHGLFSRTFSSNVTDQAGTSSVCSLPFPPACANDFLVVASAATDRARDSESLLFVPGPLGICLGNGATLPDGCVSEQSVRYSSFTAVPCCPRCTLKLGFNVLASPYLSPQLVAVRAAAHQTSSA